MTVALWWWHRSNLALEINAVCTSRTQRFARIRCVLPFKNSTRHQSVIFTPKSEHCKLHQINRVSYSYADGLLHAFWEWFNLISGREGTTWSRFRHRMKTAIERKMVCVCVSSSKSAKLLTNSRTNYTVRTGQICTANNLFPLIERLWDCSWNDKRWSASSHGIHQLRLARAHTHSHTHTQMCTTTFAIIFLSCKDSSSRCHFRWKRKHQQQMNR